MKKFCLLMAAIACLAFVGCSDSNDSGTNPLVGSKWERSADLGSIGIWEQNIDFISGNTFRYNSYIDSYGQKEDEWTVNIGYKYSEDGEDIVISGMWPFEDGPSPFVAIILLETGDMALKIEGESAEYFKRID